MTREGEAQNETSVFTTTGRWVIIAVILTIVVLVAYNVEESFSFEQIYRYHQAVTDWRDQHPHLAVAAYIGAYILAVAVSVPGAIWLTVIGGFLFGALSGGTYAILSEVIGACATFLVARFLLGDWIRAGVGAGSTIHRMRAGFNKHPLSYMLFLRLMPVFPFWLINLVPALLNVPFRIFLIGTLVGVIPVTLIYATLGEALSTVIAAGSVPDADVLYQPRVLLPLVALALLALMPVVYRTIRGRTAKTPPEQDTPED